MSGKQAILVGLIIALVCAGTIWFLEDFERKQIIRGVAEEWGKYVSELPERKPQ